MEKIPIIEKTKGMDKKGAIDLLKYHEGLQEAKIRRLERQVEETKEVRGAIRAETERRVKGDA